MDNFESIKATVEGGGTRIELCSSLLVSLRIVHCALATALQPKQTIQFGPNDSNESSLLSRKED